MIEPGRPYITAHNLPVCELLSVNIGRDARRRNSVEVDICRTTVSRIVSGTRSENRFEQAPLIYFQPFQAFSY